MIQQFIERYQSIRNYTLSLTSTLTEADQTVQSMPDASPSKWHLAHTTWFFETFLLSQYAPGYRVFSNDYAYLFNSYYNGVGARQPRPLRGMLTRPALAEIHHYRQHVDKTMLHWLQNSGIDDTQHALIELGFHHEQQHQELLLMDIQHLFSQSPLYPAYDKSFSHCLTAVGEKAWVPVDGGTFTIGHEGEGFHFDNEAPSHRVILNAFLIGRQLVSNREWQAFIEDGGYQSPLLWLSDGWDWRMKEQRESPLYWRNRDNEWWRHSLAGLVPVEPELPVCHISYYEADAFARWSGARLPTEAEWEIAANIKGSVLQSIHGQLWQWTQSAYCAYPGFLPAPGAVGEYNGKFMNNQYVLRGSSFATPEGHARNTYRNFYYPHQSWQFSGLRLAKNENH